MGKGPRRAYDKCKMCIGSVASLLSAILYTYSNSIVIDMRVANFTQRLLKKNEKEASPIL
jgi:uncharacterized membrane protein